MIEIEQDVIDRLRASRDRDNEKDLAAGRERGVAWAKRHAEAVELRRLKSERDQLKEAAADEDRWIAMFMPFDGRRLDPGRWLFGVIVGDGDVSRRDAMHFWALHLGATPDGPDEGRILRGFAEGRSRFGRPSSHACDPIRRGGPDRIIGPG